MIINVLSFLITMNLVAGTAYYTPLRQVVKPSQCEIINSSPGKMFTFFTVKSIFKSERVNRAKTVRIFAILGLLNFESLANLKYPFYF